MSLRLKEGVLIPRPDTELIIEKVLEFYKKQSKLRSTRS